MALQVRFDATGERDLPEGEKKAISAFSMPDLCHQLPVLCHHPPDLGQTYAKRRASIPEIDWVWLRLVLQVRFDSTGERDLPAGEKKAISAHLATLAPADPLFGPAC